jgi:hypothetical protein
MAALELRAGGRQQAPARWHAAHRLRQAPDRCVLLVQFRLKLSDLLVCGRSLRLYGRAAPDTQSPRAPLDIRATRTALT